jgi:hypothetical protein
VKLHGVFAQGHEIFSKQAELKEAEGKLAQLEEALDWSTHKAGSHEHNQLMRRWSDQRQLVKALRNELERSECRWL